MINEAILDYYILNGVLYPNNKCEVDKITAPSIYEVIRIIDGVPLFKEEHLERMRKSAKLLGYQMIKTDREISDEINRLIRANKCLNLNIKLICSNLDEDNQTFLMYFIESHYPQKMIYENGINTILFNSERKNPNVKLRNVDLRSMINSELKREDAYEALLVNENENITEGSRSNIFFVKDDKVYTAPSGEVLLGVTRNKILNACESLAIKVFEDHIHINQLDEFDGAFMTGTSVDVLPITTIDNSRFDSVNNNIIINISKEYLKYVKEYIEARKDQLEG